MIAFEHVNKRYGEHLALDDLSWSMEEGECVTLLGPSGSGKTTALRLITHEELPSSGQVTVGTFPAGRLSRRHRALLRRMLGIIYEDFRLLADRSVFENVALALRITGRLAAAEVIPKVMNALQEVGLAHKQRAFPPELSAGERQRAAIARAIVHRPAVILADEPTGNLERRTGREVLALLRRLHEEGTAFLLATSHDEVAAAFPGRTLRLEDGRLVGENGARSLRRPAAEAAASIPAPAGSPPPEPPTDAAASPQSPTPPSAAAAAGGG